MKRHVFKSFINRSWNRRNDRSISLLLLFLLFLFRTWRSGFLSNNNFYSLSWFLCFLFYFLFLFLFLFLTFFFLFFCLCFFFNLFRCFLLFNRSLFRFRSICIFNLFSKTIGTLLHFSRSVGCKWISIQNKRSLWLSHRFFNILIITVLRC